MQPHPKQPQQVGFIIAVVQAAWHARTSQQHVCNGMPAAPRALALPAGAHKDHVVLPAALLDRHDLTVCIVLLLSAAVRELEAWTKAEMLQLASKLKAVVQSCSNHQQQVNLQVWQGGRHKK